MKHLTRVLGLLFLLFIPLIGNAQEEKQYYLYNIVTFSGSLNTEGFKMDIDNGVEIKKIRDDNGQRITFKTPAGALTYLISKGWEMYVNGATTSGFLANGTGSSSTNSYWIIRKPCTKEEFEEAVKMSIKR